MRPLIFLDTETTGLDPKKDRLCEVCYQVGEELHTARFKPPVPMSVKAMSITHITNRMLEHEPVFIGSDTYRALEQLLPEGILVAHNARYDVGMLEAEGLSVPRYICTLKVARHLDEEGVIPEYNLQYLRYYHDLEIDGGAHDAETDVRVLGGVFTKLLHTLMDAESLNEEAAIDRMLEMTKLPTLIRTLTFGKHIGRKIADVAETDAGYLEWLLMQKRNDPTGNNEDWIYTLEYYLAPPVV